MHQEVFGEYRELVEDMCQEAATRGDMNSIRYHGLVKALVDDLNEDIDEIGRLVEHAGNWSPGPENRSTGRFGET